MFNFAHFLDMAFLDVDEDFCYIVHFDTDGHTAFEIDTSTHTFKTMANCPGHDDYLNDLLKRESSTITVHKRFNKTVQPLIHKSLVNRETWQGKVNVK